MIRTDRLILIPATVETTTAALVGRVELAAALGVIVPASWPHDLLDEDALEYTIERLAASEIDAGWWLYFVCTSSDEAPGVLIGSVGYKGPPGPDATVEIGYGIVNDQQRRGFATEAASGLLAHAFGFDSVNRVIAETLPSLEASIGVLNKVGFRFVGQGSEDGVIRFEITRSTYKSMICKHG